VAAKGQLQMAHGRLQIADLRLATGPDAEK
jgi:hypothetical protein